MTSVRKSWWLITTIVALVFAALLDFHLRMAGAAANIEVPLNFISFLWLLSTIGLAYANKDFEATFAEIRNLDVCVVVPTYNEDPATFVKALQSLERQTRTPQNVLIIDDGSTSRECLDAFLLWRFGSNLNASYSFQHNSGKRHAQARAFQMYPEADVYVTIDSDTVLDERAIENGLKPFVDKRVMSVAGTLVGLNDRTNLLTRLVDLSFVNSFMNGRAAWSRLRSVSVNCGGLAFYRGFVVHKYLDEYVSQTVFGHQASSGDDRILTNFAALEGWTVLQESSVGFTLLPDNIGHLIRQRIRWWRSFFWGGLWLIRRFPINKPLWWLVTWQFFNFLAFTLILPLIIISVFSRLSDPAAVVIYAAGLAYVRSARYLSIKRPDQPFIEQLITYLLSPLSTMLNFLMCTVLQYVGLVTVANTGWGTRNQVEVSLASSGQG